MALFINLAFGSIFTDRPELGVFDQGESRVVSILSMTESLDITTYESESAVKKATATGSLDMGIVLPSDFDSNLQSGVVRLKAYVWGESQARSRAVIPVALADAVRSVTGSTLPVDVETVALGDERSVPWSDRLLPLVVLMGVFYSGLVVPASALINEKQHRTLEALNVTPATVGDVFVAKGAVAVALATFMGVVTLMLSGALGDWSLSPLTTGTTGGLLFLVLFLGAVMAVEIGLIAGAYVKDMNGLMAVLKSAGILLYAPAIVFMFPQIPSWIGYFFPTYYVVRPVVDLSISGAGFGDVALYIGVLLALVVAGGGLVANVVNRLSTRALRLNA
jgi:ABC-2 type transport system permease protein